MKTTKKIFAAVLAVMMIALMIHSQQALLQHLQYHATLMPVQQVIKPTMLVPMSTNSSSSQRLILQQVQ